MANKDLENLLIEYEQKRRTAELEADNRKNKLYEKFPEIQKLDFNINKLTINKTKNILVKNTEINKKIDDQINNLKIEKNKILKNNNINLEFLKPIYECKICKDTGYIINEMKKTEMCNCLKQKLFNISYNKSNLSNLSKENFENFNINIFSNEVNIEKYKKCKYKVYRKF